MARNRDTEGISLGLVTACLLAGMLASPPVAAETQLNGEAIQGGLIFGQTTPGATVMLDDTVVLTSPDGHFVIGFDRDESGTRELVISQPKLASETITLQVKPRDYAIERVDGLPPRTVTPDPEAAERIKQEAAMVSSARQLRDQRTDYVQGFGWPAAGRISGVYGSQRVLNGEPGRPHYGLDIAAPTGDPVFAPAPGVITLAHDDMYFSGGTLILDHGQGLSSTFLHLSKILVKTGDKVEQGALIARIGATGRASGPHLDWRMNWLNRRVDPQLLLSGEPAALNND